jgi:1-acyl-sn-glycerol-3-phosphate acyltransferase
MLLWLDFLLSLASAILYAILGDPSGFLGVLAIIGVFAGAFLSIVIASLLFFLFVFTVFEKTNPKSMFKHTLLNLFTYGYYNQILRVKVVVTGRENLPKNNKFVIYSNHIEASDPMYIKHVYWQFPVSFVSKEVLFKQPVVKNILSGLGCIPISPIADRRAANSILQSIKRVEAGQPMAVFPEGKRTYGNHLIDFRPGAFKLAMKPQADICPVAVYGMHGIYRKGRILPITVYLAVLPILRYDEYKDLDTVQLAQKVHDIVLDQMNKYAEMEKK